MNQTSRWLSAGYSLKTYTSSVTKSARRSRAVKSTSVRQSVVLTNEKKDNSNTNVSRNAINNYNVEIISVECTAIWVIAKPAQS